MNSFTAIERRSVLLLGVKTIHKQLSESFPTVNPVKEPSSRRRNPPRSSRLPGPSSAPRRHYHCPDFTPRAYPPSASTRPVVLPGTARGLASSPLALFLRVVCGFVCPAVDGHLDCLCSVFFGYRSIRILYFWRICLSGLLVVAHGSSLRHGSSWCAGSVASRHGTLPDRSDPHPLCGGRRIPTSAPP